MAPLFTLPVKLERTKLDQTQEESAATGFVEEYPIDQIDNVHDHYPLIFEADSSQHSALIDAAKGENLVIEGPPGSGKSQ